MTRLIWYAWMILILLTLFALYLYLIAPAKRCPDASLLVNRLYAHRGLHDGNQTVPENSLAAFTLAVEAGYGMELDVQLTADHQLVVHHDSNTQRVCGVNAVIYQTIYANLPLLPDGSVIPLLSDVLALVANRVPMIVEIKPEGKPLETAAATVMALQAYFGPYCVESFHPLVVRYLRKNAPQILRGQLAMGGKRVVASTTFSEYILLKYLLINVLGRPHFIAYSCASDHNLSLWLFKQVYKPLLAAWTIRNQAMLDRAWLDYQMPIFELFTPESKNC